MQSPVTGETTPNYFKEILLLLYADFHKFNYQSLYDKAIFSDKELLAKVLDELVQKNLIEYEQSLFEKRNDFRLTLEGFEFCRRNKDYFQLD